jgi:predicted DNA-binding ribbon-helix-helix protein
MTNEKRFKLDMDFWEAMKRFARTDPAELAQAVKEIDKEIKNVKRRAKQVDENFRDT